MGIFVLSLYNIHMFSKEKLSEEMYIELPVEDLLTEDDPLEEEEQKLQDQRDLIAAKRTHDAYNEDFEDPDDNTFEERLKALTEAMENESDAEENKEGEVPLEEEEEKMKKEAEKLALQKKLAEENEVNNRNSSLTYSLKDRKAVDLPNPIYTCQGSGKVVVMVEVNNNGYVINTKVDKKNSSTRNECLFENAVKYAQQALFSRTDLEKQRGSITYYFNYAQ